MGGQFPPLYVGEHTWKLRKLELSKFVHLVILTHESSMPDGLAGANITPDDPEDVLVSPKTPPRPDFVNSKLLLSKIPGIHRYQVRILYHSVGS